MKRGEKMGRDKKYYEDKLAEMAIRDKISQAKAELKKFREKLNK